MTSNSTRMHKILFVLGSYALQRGSCCKLIETGLVSQGMYTCTGMSFANQYGLVAIPFLELIV